MPELFPSSLMSVNDISDASNEGSLVFDQLRTTLSEYLDQPASSELWEKLLANRRIVSAVILKLPRKETQTRLVDDARQLVREVSGSGMHDRVVAAEDFSLAQAAAKKGWQGLLAAMLLTPAWQWPDAPLLLSVPEWLRADYVAWLFAWPQGFSEPGQAEVYAAYTLQRLEELVRWLDRCPGLAAETAVLASYANQASVIPLYFSAGSLRRHAELRGRLLLRALGQPNDHCGTSAVPRIGRRLRIGVVNRHFGPQTETYCTLPTFEQLDPERFEVILFCHKADASALEGYCRQQTAGFVLLPNDLVGQLEQLRASRLDVIVFGTNLTAVCNEVLRLALHRVAPLQVVNNSSCITSGLPECDLYISGDLTETAGAPAHFSERLGLIPGPTHAFNYDADRLEPTAVCRRSDYGLPEEALVFVSAANYFKIIPEMQHAWARLLAAAPGSHLLVHPFNPNWWSNYPVKRFRAEFEQVLVSHGVDAARLTISTTAFPSRTDVKTLLGLGDIYLDSHPFGGVNSMVDPLELGMPVVAWDGETMRARMGGSLLRSLGLTELIANSAEAYHAIALRLAREPAFREATSNRVRAKMKRAPLFLDPLASSEAFGDLIERAFDEMVAVGAKAFRANREPLRAASLSATIGDQTAVGEVAQAREVLRRSPNDATARQVIGRDLLASGRTDRAIKYLLGALQGEEAQPGLWIDVARALRANGQMGEALQALEAGLNLDQTLLEGWMLYAEVAHTLGSLEIARQAAGVARQLAPDDPRLVSWPARWLGEAGPRSAEQPSAKPHHLLLYTDDPEFGGVAQWNHNILLALAKQGYRVTCVQTQCNNPLFRDREAAGIRHVWLDHDTGKEFARTLEDRSHAEKIFRADPPDLVVFADCCPVSNLAARQTAMEQGIPYVTVVHFVGEYLARNFAAYLPKLAQQHAAAKAVVAVSEENLDLLHRHFGTPASQGLVIHNGRPPRFFQPQDAAVRQRLRAEQRIPDDAVVCFTAARLTSVKGFAYQLEAIKILKRNMGLKNLYFVWAGDGDQRSALTKQIADLQVGENIRILGHRWDIADWYDAADIFVLPSELEGMPLSIMEAMAKGVPVIATAVSGTPEELGGTGKLLPNPAKDAPGVVRELAQTIEAWARNPELRAEQGRLGRERADLMFREALMVERTLGLLATHLAPA